MSVDPWVEPVDASSNATTDADAEALYAPAQADALDAESMDADTTDAASAAVGDASLAPIDAPPRDAPPLSRVLDGQRVWHGDEARQVSGFGERAGTAPRLATLGPGSTGSRPEDRNTTHWLENGGTIPAVEISVDMVNEE